MQSSSAGNALKAQPLPKPSACVKRTAPYPAETPGGSRRNLRFGALGRHLRRYSEGPPPAAADRQRVVFRLLAHAPTAFWSANGYLAPAYKAFTNEVRML